MKCIVFLVAGYIVVCLLSWCVEQIITSVTYLFPSIFEDEEEE